MADGTRTGTDVALMFTGGIDTMLAANLLAARFERIHLLTFSNGICVRLHTAAAQARALEKQFGPDRIVHSLIDITGLFGELRRDFPKLVRQYPSPLMFDLCCRLAMEAHTVIYCRRNGIRDVADGNNAAQGQIFLQQAGYLARVDRMFEEFGIRCTHPVYGYTDRSHRKAQLSRLGMRNGMPALERLHISSHLLEQPFCLWGVVSFFFTSPLRRIPVMKHISLPVDRALRLREDRERIARRYIEELTS